ncbi:enoyl-[acyl-carrier-protein] reductase FabK [Fusibacter bizertensis]|jgi:putative enoyl-(acyl-carrier-protein) reductase II|uniref:Probable nitronate monooxygenase n=1 Tax=Fusibacter bizertensis TaxID=1488331 RepID=A0ABT6NBW9_9FIRM|nr:enoyl-[acyl-carrier-protein] reductase FabK [Fusibacter bizertensis]MDH8677913.1 enoyl-[acyl-carrier-protein] reductase FabK [Fusibacter bizertensis]
MRKTVLSQLLGIEFPIIQGGMAWISDAELAAAVSNAGGLGVIAGGNAPRDIVKQEIDKINTLTNRPYALNVMLLSPFADDIIDLAIEKKVPIVITGAGSPGKYIERLKEAQIKIIPVVPSVALARRMESLGVDALIAEGTEAGGHIGELTTMTLVPQVVDAVKIPVVAAGGIADGRGAAAAFMLGADGIQVGTRFLVAHECNVHANYKEMVIDAKDTSAVVSGRPTGHPVRILKNKLYRQYCDLEKKGASVDELEAVGAGALKKAAVDGDVVYGSVMAGQVAGLVKKMQPAKEIVDEIFDECDAIILKQFQRIAGK